MKVLSIDLDKIEQNENSRVIYKASDLSELMQSMKKHGQLQPVGVRKIANGKYDAVFGNRRIIAAKKLGWTSIDASVMEGIDEDKERDILNLIENIKRQNTTVAEDGRMFCVLRDYGLTIPEIAARLDVNDARVQTAIDVYSVVPKEYHAKIINRTTGKTLKGKISASAAHEIMNLRKKHSLNRKQTRTLLDFASNEDNSAQHVMRVAPLMKEGLSLREALKAAEGLARVTCDVFMDKKDVDRLEKKHGCSINEVLIKALIDSGIPIHRKVRGAYENKTRAHRGASGRIGAHRGASGRIGGQRLTA
jgi:ParB/RepB/Spo0J family partition protein